MQDLLSDQVAARISDPSRSLELDILRSGAWAGTAQAEIDALRLARRLAVSEGDLSRALQRLIQEHLVRSPKPGTLAGLHQLRSEELLRTHQLPLPTLDASFENTVVSVHPTDLEPLIADALSQRRLPVSAVVHGLISRLEQEPHALALASALRGLGSGRIAAGVDEWLGTSEARALPRTQVGSAAMMGVSLTSVASLFSRRSKQQPIGSRKSKVRGKRSATSVDGSDVAKHAIRLARNGRPKELERDPCGSGRYAFDAGSSRRIGPCTAIAALTSGLWVPFWGH